MVVLVVVVLLCRSVASTSTCGFPWFSNRHSLFSLSLSLSFRNTRRKRPWNDHPTARHGEFVSCCFLTFWPIGFESRLKLPKRKNLGLHFITCCYGARLCSQKSCSNRNDLDCRSYLVNSRLIFFSLPVFVYISSVSVLLSRNFFFWNFICWIKVVSVQFVYVSEWVCMCARTWVFSCTKVIFFFFSFFLISD